jgi:hypothetical protein
MKRMRFLTHWSNAGLDAKSLTLIAGLLLAFPSVPALANSAAGAALQEFATYCDRGAYLWNAPLCGPVILVDPGSRAAIANVEPPESGFQQQADGLWAGTVPASFPLANTSAEWAATHWAAVMLPLPDDATARRVLIAHESFHRIQRVLGLGPTGGDNGHLDAKDGRIYARLEMAALTEALRAAQQDRPWQSMARDALAYRATRFAVFQGSAQSEAALLVNEGLAEYTGVVVGAADQSIAFAIGRLETGAQRPSLIRSFGYVVGPAYGLLLDRSGRNWREAALAGEAVPDLLQNALGAPAQLKPDMEAYNASAIIAEETERDREVQRRRRALTALLVDGPTVTFPAEAMQIEFDSNTLFSLGGEGTVYSREIRVRDGWGELLGTGDVLISPGWNFARVPGPATISGDQLNGPGWTARIRPGYSLVPGKRSGDLVLMKGGD